ncbi:MAG: DUF421 domain-containing protein [Williamsia sp.]|nr:DUF421 domain-containing protein [Williamsia sp.]
MKPEDIQWGDWHRILFGETPPLYLLEVVVRVAIIYTLILIAIRSMGKRLPAELSRAELVARVSIAAAVGLPIQRPSRGLLGAAVVAAVIVLVGRWLAAWAYKSRRFEKAYQGYYVTIVQDGVLNIPQVKKSRVTKERIFAALRGEGIKHLGEVKRLYLEANGKFSLVPAEKKIPGLSIIPDWDAGLRQRQQETADTVCSTCGKNLSSTHACQECGGKETERALL